MRAPMPTQDTELTRDSAPHPVDQRMVGRAVHPWGWWLWAIGLTVAVNLTDNPWQLLAIDAAAIAVALARRGEEPWNRALGLYVAIGGIVVAIRMVFAVCFSATSTGHILFTLPQVHLPNWMAGIRIGGPVAAETLALALFDALQLASMIICLGVAVSLASPRRSLRSVPPALHELSVAVVIALTVAPQLAESIARIRRAQRLRGELPTGMRQLVRIGVPALEDAVNRSLSLAAGMESRGFGRTGGRRSSPLTPVLLICACACIPVGVYLVLTNTSVRTGAGLGAAGLVFALTGIHLAGRGIIVSRYRPDPWRGVEWGLTAVGLGVAASITVLSRLLDAWTTDPSNHPVPGFDPLMIAVACLAASPALFTPAAAPLLGTATPADPLVTSLRPALCLRGQDM
ncbi:hypothetical protein HMPREF1531_00468 [Propionibacterium sp. oral taxon 192 str. F0372]|nr:hypothetical protein HMPREF1531_00468 [Propionibacterium sp. oral taxon 192 str. F0372]